MEKGETVLRFLESVGHREEAEFYLALFRAEARERFALISVDPAVLRHAADAVVQDLRFLGELGLVPTLTIGLTDGSAAEVHEQGIRLRRRLADLGLATELVPLGDEGAPAARIASAIHSGVLPIVPFSEEASVDARFDRLGGLITALRTRKLIVLSRRGALTLHGAKLPFVNLTTEYEAVASARELSRARKELLRQLRRLVLEIVPHKLVCAITSPLELLRELFTVGGSGTLLRRGAVIERRDGLHQVDAARLQALLASSFGRPPLPAFFERPVSRVYVEEAYRGAALLVDTPLGAYLSKFAVDHEAQGEGIGRDLWQRLISEVPVVFWRSRAGNPIGAWYAKECDGLARFPDWHVYWKGVAVERIPDVIRYALDAPVDLLEVVRS